MGPMTVMISDFVAKCIDQNTCEFEITYGRDGKKKSVNVFYEFCPMNGTVLFEFDDEDYPEGQIFGVGQNKTNAEIVNDMILALASYLVGACKIVLKGYIKS